MANVYDYIEWRGDVPLSVSPFNEIDGMILSRLAYLPFEEIMPVGEWAPVGVGTMTETMLYGYKNNRIRLTKNQYNILTAIKGCARFEKLELIFYVNIFDKEAQNQFAAITFRLSPELFFAAFRGTDNTLVGWKENLNMSFCCPVPAQKQAVRYLETVAGIASVNTSLIGGNKCSFIVGGHSKGGNLAVYSSAFSDARTRGMISKIYNYDGPGFNQTVTMSDSYREVCSRAETFVPQSSVVGMLLEHEEKYTIVKSTDSWLNQHDTAGWQLTKNGFVTLESVTSSSRFIDYTLKEWMRSLSPERREKLVDAVYAMMLKTDTETLREFGKNKYANFKKLWQSFRGLDEQTREDISYAMKLLLRSAKLGMIRMLGEK